MAVLGHIQLLVLVIIACTVSGELRNKPRQGTQLPQNPMNGLVGVKHTNKLAADSLSHGKIDAELLKKLQGLGALPSDLGSNPALDMREWLIIKAKEHKENMAAGKIDVMDDTPLGDISLTCYNDVMQFFGDLETFQIYALKMYSSFGESTAWFKGLFTGNAKSAGAYELCVGITPEEDSSPFDTQFCYLQTPLVAALGVTAAIGSCWPSTCSARELEIAHKTFLEDQEISIYYDCLVDTPWTGGAIATLCVLSFFALFVLIGSVYHVAIHNHVTSMLKSLAEVTKLKSHENTYEQVVVDENHKGDPIYQSAKGEDSVAETRLHSGNENDEKKNNPTPDTKSNGITKLLIEDETVKKGTSAGNSFRKLAFVDRLLMSFSAFHNTEKIFDTSASSSMLGALNGIRVLSMWWVILGHSNQFLLGYRYDNPAYALEISGNTAFKAVANGTFSVDTFFFLSGLLVTYLLLKQLAKTNGRVNWALFYFHRFWRITPVYMICVAIWATLGPYLGKGAGKADFFTGVNQVCQDYWWTHLLYINNLYPFPGNLSFQTCMGWAWYLADDMQFFLISPFIIFFLYRYWKWGVSLITFLCLVSFGSTAYVCWYWGLGVGGTGLYNNRTETTPDVTSGDDFIYTKPWCRIQAYLVGMMLGYIFYRMNGKPYKMNVFVNLLGWAVSAAIALTVIYGLQATYSGPTTPQWLAIVYNSTSRFAFCVSIAWVTFACVTGNGGYINRFLSWSVWTPLARLTFAAYLIHPIIIFLVILTMKNLFHWTFVNISYWFISNVVASYACAYILSILVEGPTVGLEKALIGSPSKDKKNK